MPHLGPWDGARPITVAFTGQRIGGGTPSVKGASDEYLGGKRCPDAERRAARIQNAAHPRQRRGGDRVDRRGGTCGGLRHKEDLWFAFCRTLMSMNCAARMAAARQPTPRIAQRA